VSYQRSRVLATACTCVLAMAATNALAQGAPATAKITELEEVVVTGSFITGTPEDSAMPVEVIGYEELQNLGRPSNLDLVKTMSEVGATMGEVNRANLYPQGAATVNLRSLGPQYTTVVFNNRRFPEQYSVATGRFNNVSWIPNAAIGSVETLKAGGSATYGADAVAGVVNYITRKNVEGLELNADYRHIEDSDGDYTADAVWGKKLDNGNFMVTAGYQHRSTLHSIDRPWGDYEYLENPSSWTGASSPGSYAFQRPVGAAATQTTYTPAATSATGYAGNRQMSSTGVVRDPNCTALGGFAGWSTTPSPLCYFNTAQYENSVSKSNSYQLYAEFNQNLFESTKLHVEAVGYYQDLPDIALASSLGSDIASYPMAPVPAGSPVGTLPTIQLTTLLPGGVSTYYVAGQNPAVRNFLENFRNANGTTAFTNTPGTGQIDTIVNTGRGTLPTGTWRPFGAGGSPYSGRYDVQHNTSLMWRFTTSLGSDLPKFFGTDLNWELGLTYSRVRDTRATQDILVDRLQGALNGFGGANCNGIRADLPNSTCQYFNPYSSTIERNYYTGAPNPGFVGAGSFPGYLPGTGLQNNADLVGWMYVPINMVRTYTNYVVDPIVRGDLGVELPGGPVQIAFGGQFRMQTEDVVLDDLSNRNINLCTTPGLNDCASAARTGPLAFTRPNSVFGTTRDDRRRFPVYAAFLESKLPILSSLEVGIAGRYEKFISDLSDKDNSVVVPAASVKWKPLDWLGVRSSWGKTFSQVNPPREVPPTTATSISVGNTYSGFGGAASGAQFVTNNYPNRDIKPERGTFADFGLVFNPGNFTATVDYYYIRIDDRTRTMVVSDVINSLVLQGAPKGLDTLINCSSPMFAPQPALGGRSFVELNGPCIQGNLASLPTDNVSRLNSNPGASLTAAGGLVRNPGATPLVQPASGAVNYFGGTGQTNGGSLTTRGIDLSASYRFDDFLGGSVTTSIDYSRILEWHLGDTFVGGAKVADGYDGIGFLNQAQGRVGISVAKYRASFGVLYRRDVHTLNFLARYMPSLINDDESDYTILNTRNANIGDVNGFTPSGAACTAPQTLRSDLGSVPAGAGTGLYATPPLATGTRGFCAAQNTVIETGQQIDRSINFDLIYRAQLADDVGLTLSIYNLTDEEPTFQRGTVGYASGYVGPLGRNIKLGLSKKF